MMRGAIFLNQALIKINHTKSVYYRGPWKIPKKYFLPDLALNWTYQYLR
jgi:hypothetical protein